MRKWNELQLRFELEGFDEVEGDATERAISQEEARQISEGAWREFEQLTKVSGRPVDLSIGEEGDGKGWFREYVRLREQGWPWRVGAYMAWAASPKNRRWPESIQDLATKVLGLKGPRVIYQWRHKYPAIDAVVAMMQAAPLFEHRRDVLEALVTMARTADYKSFNDRKLFLEMVGDYVPKSQVGVGVSARDLSELSDEELDGLLGVNIPASERGELHITDKRIDEGDPGSAQGSAPGSAPGSAIPATTEGDEEWGDEDD